MNIKNIITGIATVTFLTCCSNIADDERLIFIGTKELPSGAVLVEDFTGQRCTWCPSGTRILEEQQELYGSDKVITVAIHSGPLGFKGTASATGLLTDLGEYYWTKNGFTTTTSQPTSVFNRRAVTDDRDQWGSQIYKELSRAMKVAMTAETSYTADTRNVGITVNYMGSSEMGASLQLWLIENGIVAMQIDGGQTKRDYTHNHVLREAINGDDGEPISINTEEKTLSCNYTIPEKYVAENCEIVAFIYNEEGVLQVVKKGVTKGTETETEE